MLKKFIYFAIVFVVISSCKSTKTVSGVAIVSMSSKKIVKKYNVASFDKKTISATIRAKYNDGKVSQSVAVKMRMIKDSVIWMSGRFLGIPMAKILITPNSVQFYEKVGKSYFDGDFELLSNFLGTDVDFYVIQNLLLGESIESFENRKLKSEIDEGSYRLEPIEQKDLYDILFWVNPVHFKMNRQEIRQPALQKKMAIKYSNYQTISKEVFPKNINIIAVDKSEKIFLDLEYRFVEFDRKVSFPFSIPSGFKKIELNE